MLVEAGHYALALALGVSFIQMVVPIWGSHRGDRELMAVATPAALVSFACVGFSYLALTMAYILSDFSVINVIRNSHSLKPLIYKISGVWSNHEGSMMLWVLILTFFGAMVAIARKSVPERLRANTLAVQGAVTFAFIIFLLTVSNPFLRALPPYPEGEGLNPILQDLGLAIHPPLLYLGYVGFSISFAFAIAALIDGKIDAAWARIVRPWTLSAWIFLTLGIAMGSYWAYYELGWGGWWFWDPVENASLMPWLSGTALIHSTVVMERRDSLKVWTILLAILTFSLSLLGTFIVRSGVLTSVHSFAVDPKRGLFVLGILVLFIGGSLGLFAWRAPMLRKGGIFAPISREGGLVLNNLLLSAACTTVFVGTLYPLALEALTGAKISVGAPFFNLTFLPIILPLLAFLPIGQTLAWKRGDFLSAAQRLMFVYAIAIAITLAMLAVMREGPVIAPLGVGMGIYLILGAMNEIVVRSWKSGQSVSVSIRKVAGLPLSTWGTALAHAGVGISVIGIAATAWGTETIASVKKGDILSAGPYQVRLEQINPREGVDYSELAAKFSILQEGKVIGQTETMKRVYVARSSMPTTEAGIVTFGFGQIYVSFGDVREDNSIGVRLYYKPLVLLIWIGSLIMAIGGGISLSDRRYRVGVPKLAQKAAEPSQRTTVVGAAS